MKIPPAAWSLILLILLGLAVLGFQIVRPSTDRAPDFTVPTTNGDAFTLKDHRGQIVVIDFFATYCADCVIIEKNLKAASADWNRDNVTLLSLSVAPFDTLEDLQAYKERHNLTWLVAKDEDNVGQRYAVYELGRVVIVDAFGRVVFAKSGSFQITPDALRQVVADSLAQRQAPAELAQLSIWGLAIVAGVASFFSPCAVGLLPGYVAHTVRRGTAAARWTHALRLGLLSAAGLLLVFLGIGGLLWLIGRAVARYLPWFGPFIGLLLILVGLLLFLRPYSILLQRFFQPLLSVGQTESEGPRSGASFFVYGLGYGAGAAGCTAPVLLSLVGTAAAFGPSTTLTALLVYASSAALLMVVLTLAIALSGDATRRLLRTRALWIERASATLFILGGLFLVWYARRAGTLSF